MKTIFDREIHVVGVQRTGQHAVTSWLIGHFDSVNYKNCMSQLGRKKGKMHGIEPPFWFFSNEKEEYNNDSLKKSDVVILGTEFTIYDVGLNPELPVQKEDYCKKFFVDSFSEREDFVLVIRNPYNQYASILNWGMNRLLSHPNSFSNMWIKMAKECLSYTNNFENKVVLKYDDWFSNSSYRRDIEKRLDLIEDDSRLNVVMKIGGRKSWGSSFDGMKKKTNAQAMDVLNRWKVVKDDERFLRLLKNKELRDLSKELGLECPE